MRRCHTVNNMWTSKDAINITVDGFNVKEICNKNQIYPPKQQLFIPILAFWS